MFLNDIFIVREKCMKKLKYGIIGCGNILWAYMKGEEIFHQIELVGIADIFPEKAKEAAEKNNCKAFDSVEDLLKDESIELVVNLTIPAVHGKVDKQILNAGKHVFSEKPLACDLKEAREVLELAKSKNLIVGCAPDTFLGAGLQTCLKIIEDGWIGEVYGLNAHMIGGGPDGWHPNPDFFFKEGGGPMLDMGPYYLTAMVAMFGPIASVTAVSYMATKERVLDFPVERMGDKIKVEVPTTNNAIYKFKNGVVANFTCSFDAKGGSTLPPFEVYGTKGTLLVPDPNSYGMPIKVMIPGQEVKEIPYCYNYTDYMRGLAIADMACAIRSGREHRVSGELAYHVLEAMLSTYVSSEKGETVKLKSKVNRPARLPMGLARGILDL